ncbi:MAG: glycosyltransferase family 2 protein [Bacteroidales bacterium]
MNTPLISIIIPVYNTEKYLAECLDSALAQTYTNFELLLINDGSKDSSPQICDEYAAKDNRIKVFHQENAGVSAARNKGLDNAKGEYVGFVDADDTVTSEYLERMNGKMQEGVDLVYFGYSKINTTNGDVHYIPPTNSNKTGESLLKEIISQHKTLTPWMCLIKKDIIHDNKMKFVEGCRYGEDQEFVFKVLMNCETVASIDQSLYNYRVGHVSAVSTRSLAHFDYVEAMFRTKKYMEDLSSEHNSIVELFNNKKIPASIIYVVNMCLLGNSPKEIVKKIRSSKELSKYYKNINTLNTISPLHLTLLRFVPNVYMNIMLWRRKFNSAK